MWLEVVILRASEPKNGGDATFLLHSHLLVSFNAVFPLQTPAPVMELVDVPDSKSGAARRGGSSPPRGTIPLLIFSPDQLGSRVAFAMIIGNKSF
jgi:hypothetical protein